MKFIDNRHLGMFISIKLRFRNMKHTVFRTEYIVSENINLIFHRSTIENMSDAVNNLTKNLLHWPSKYVEKNSKKTMTLIILAFVIKIGLKCEWTLVKI